MEKKMSNCNCNGNCKCKGKKKAAAPQTVFVDVHKRPSKAVKLKVGDELALIKTIAVGGHVVSGINAPAAHFAASPKMMTMVSPLRVGGQPANTEALWVGVAQAKGTGNLTFVVTPLSPGHAGQTEGFDYVVS
jgi:hypothetical protein